MDPLLITKDLAYQIKQKSEVFLNYQRCLKCHLKLDESDMTHVIAKAASCAKKNLPFNFFKQWEGNDLASKTGIAFLELKEIQRKAIKEGIPESVFYELCED